jgi:hypothetical protein
VTGDWWPAGYDGPPLVSLVDEIAQGIGVGIGDEITVNVLGREITAKVARLGCRIYEVPVSYSGRTYAEGKKINWKDGFSALRCILQYNLLG